jgi:hypothetical protein
MLLVFRAAEQLLRSLVQLFGQGRFVPHCASLIDLRGQALNTLFLGAEDRTLNTGSLIFHNAMASPRNPFSQRKRVSKT